MGEKLNMSTPFDTQKSIINRLNKRDETCPYCLKDRYSYTCGHKKAVPFIDSALNPDTKPCLKSTWKNCFFNDIPETPAKEPRNLEGYFKKSAD